MTTPAKPYRKPEAKTIAAPIGGGLGGALVPFIIWLLGVYVWDAPSDASHAIAAAAAVPPPITGMITFVVPAALALAAAYWAPHTHRPDLANEVPSAAAADTIAEAAMRIDVATAHLDERMANQHEVNDVQHTGPIDRIHSAPDFLSSVMDEAHD